VAQKSDAAAEGEAAQAEGAAAGPQRKRRPAADDAGAEEVALKDVMMTRKARKMYQGLQRSRAAKKARVTELEQRAAALKTK
jgi:pescadillo protein